MNPGSRLFGIVQGGMFEDLRSDSLRGLQNIESGRTLPLVACPWARARKI